MGVGRLNWSQARFAVPAEEAAFGMPRGEGTASSYDMLHDVTSMVSAVLKLSDSRSSIDVQASRRRQEPARSRGCFSTLVQPVELCRQQEL